MKNSKVIITPHNECTNCIICHAYIGKGNDPAVCSDKCKELYLIECEYNRMCKESTDKHKNNEYNINISENK